MLVSMDITVLYLAVPALSADLQPTSSQLLWIVDIYGFMIAGSLITMGTLGDRIGRRRLLLIGAAAFGVASVVAAFSNSAEMLIATRALLGVAGATLMPSTLSLIRNMFLNSKDRTTAIGFWMAGFSVGGAMGPLVGGLLLEHLWWGAAFLIGVPCMALLLVLGPMLLPEFKDPSAGRLDVTSAALSLVGVLAVILGVKQFAEHGAAVESFLAVLVGLGVLGAFLLRQRGLADPLIDLRLFRVPAYSASLATNTLAVFLAFGVFLFVAQYLQLVEGLSPLRAGLWMIPSSAVFVVGAMVAPRLVRRVRPSYIVGFGLLVAALGLGIMTQASAASGLVALVVGSVVLDLGLSLVFTLSTDLIVGTAPPERAGAASAVSETANELGGALGIAVIGSIGTAVYRRQVAGEIPAGLSPESVAVARDTLGGALTVAEELPVELGAALVRSANEAFVHGLQLSAWISTALAVATALFAAFVLRNVRPASELEDGAPEERDLPVPADRLNPVGVAGKAE
jgi:DHA2 family multidrug resistance protein-like MFS transporter